MTDTTEIRADCYGHVDPEKGYYTSEYFVVHTFTVSEASAFLRELSCGDWEDGPRCLKKIQISGPDTETCGDPSVDGGCGRPKGHDSGHSPYRILDDPGAVPIEELIEQVARRNRTMLQGEESQ